MIKEFKSMIYQEDDKINANELYRDIDKYLYDVESTLPNDKKLSRRHPLKHILNATSGGYVSPTSMKSFELCPASYLFSKLVPEKVGSATSIGTTVHSIMEKWHNLEGCQRTEEALYSIMDELIKEDKQEESRDTIKLYVDGYLDSYDYDNKDSKIDYKNLICFNEVFIKPKINPLGVNLNIPIYLLVDRIDIRENGISVIDYKTGIGDPNPYLLGENGYLPQMIFYKWGVEAEYGQEIKSAYLCLPGAKSKEYKYTEMNVNSLVEQSKVVEQVKFHLDHIRNARNNKIFEEKIMRYCGSCPMKLFCKKYITWKKLDENLILKEIPINVNINNNDFIEEKKEG